MKINELVELIKKDISPGRFLSDCGFGWYPSTDPDIRNKVVAFRQSFFSRPQLLAQPLKSVTVACVNTREEMPKNSHHVSQGATLANANTQEDMPQKVRHLSLAAAVENANKHGDANGAASKATRETLAMNDSADLCNSYVEDVAWRLFAMDDAAVDEMPFLPPPGPLPALITEADEQSCTWSFDAENRILKATLKPGVEALSLKAKEYLLLMMERDDIAVVTGGLCRGLDKSLWNSHGIISTSGEMYHHRFRRFVRMGVEGTTGDDVKPQSQYEEMDKDVSMRVDDYFKYLDERRKRIESIVVKQGAARQLTYVNFVGEEATLDLDEVVYMLDYDIKRKLPSHYQNFKDNFLFPEILPGGNMCAMKAVRN